MVFASRGRREVVRSCEASAQPWKNTTPQYNYDMGSAAGDMRPTMHGERENFTSPRSFNHLPTSQFTAYNQHPGAMRPGFNGRPFGRKSFPPQQRPQQSFGGEQRSFPPPTGPGGDFPGGMSRQERRPEAEPSCNLCIKRLSETSTYSDLLRFAELISGTGSVEYTKVIFDHQTGHSKCFGFIYMKTVEAAMKVRMGGDKALLNGSQVAIVFAEDRRMNKPTSGMEAGRRVSDTGAGGPRDMDRSSTSTRQQAPAASRGNLREPRPLEAGGDARPAQQSSQKPAIHQDIIGQEAATPGRADDSGFDSADGSRDHLSTVNLLARGDSKAVSPAVPATMQNEDFNADDFDVYIDGCEPSVAVPFSLLQLHDVAEAASDLPARSASVSAPSAAAQPVAAAVVAQTQPVTAANVGTVSAIVQPTAAPGRNAVTATVQPTATVDATPMSAADEPAVEVPETMGEAALACMYNECCPGSTYTAAADLPAEVSFLLLYVDPSDSEFFWAILLYDNNVELEMTLTLQKMFELPDELPPLTPITLRRAVVKLDGEWTRVWVKHPVGKSVVVHCIDYGNEETVARVDLRQLPDNYWNHRPLAVPCHAHSFSPASPTGQDEFVAALNTRFDATVCHSQILGGVIDLENITPR